MIKKEEFWAEFFGTLWLVLCGCGAAIWGGSNLGLFGISSGFGLSVLAMAYALGPFSGAHLNPAISLGVYLSGRMPAGKMLYYWLAQVLGSIAASFLMYIIVKCSLMPVGDFAANGYGPFFDGNPSYIQTNTIGAFLTELILTFILVLIVLGTTDAKSGTKFAGIAIGITVWMCNMVSIPLTNCSVNPARSIGPALFSQNYWALPQLWLFIVAPLCGGVLAAACYMIFRNRISKKDKTVAV